MNIEAEIGKRYGKLTIVSLNKEIVYYYKSKMSHYKMNCVCDCGNNTIANLNSMRKGQTTSCGCYNSELNKKRMTIHGLSIREDGKRRPEYDIWIAIKKRCYNVNNKDYHHYGGRGIVMSDDWKSSFVAFYTDMGDRPSHKFSIDRENNDGNYCRENCKWVIRKVQNRNQRTNILINYNGKEQCLSAWCEELNLHYPSVRNKVMDWGWSVEEAFTKKKGEKKREKIQNGIHSTTSKLSRDQVRDIFQLDVPSAEMARAYGVVNETIRRIRMRLAYTEETADLPDNSFIIKRKRLGRTHIDEQVKQATT